MNDNMTQTNVETVGKIMVPAFAAIFAFISIALFSSVNLLVPSLTSSLVVFLTISVLAIIFNMTSPDRYLVNVDLLFSITFALYTIAVPLDVLFFGNTRYLDEDLVLIVLNQSIYALIAFTMAFYVTKSVLRMLGKIRTQRRGKADDELLYMVDNLFIARVLIVLGLGLFVVAFVSIYGSPLTYLNLSRLSRALLERGSRITGVMIAGRFIFYAGWVLLFMHQLKIHADDEQQIRKLIIWHVIFFALHGLFYFYADLRREMVILGLLLVAAWHTQTYKQVQFKHLALGLLVLFFLQTFAIARWDIGSPLEYVTYTLTNFDVTWLNIAQVEFGGQFRVSTHISSLILDNRLDFQYGRTFLNSVLSIVPRFIWSDRPPSLEIWYAQTYFNSYFQSGAGTAFSLLAEAIFNFGFFWGPVITFSGLAIFLAIWEHYTLRADTILGRFMYISSIPAILIMFRGGFSSFTKTLVISSIIPAVIYMTIMLLYDAKTRNRATPVKR